jgi:Sodium/hydrogen exchanger family
MPAELHETSLIALLAVGFVLALLFGLVANLLKVSPIVGYLIAGICVGPFTPGLVADSGLANQLAEIGVILLMFGVVVRTHSESEFKALEALGAGRVVMGERELARGMLEYALRSLGVPRERAQALAGRDAQLNPERT